jgi:hypothetical protein
MDPITIPRKAKICMCSRGRITKCKHQYCMACGDTRSATAIYAAGAVIFFTCSRYQAIYLERNTLSSWDRFANFRAVTEVNGRHDQNGITIRGSASSVDEIMVDAYALPITRLQAPVRSPHIRSIFTGNRVIGWHGSGLV